MKPTKFLSLILVMLLVASSLISCNEKTKETETETETETEQVKTATVEELGQMNRDFAKAKNARDIEAVGLLYDKNASILPPNEPIITGRENIKKYMQGFLDAGYVEGAPTTIKAESDGDLGYEMGTFTMKIKLEDGSIIDETIKYIELLKRNSEGKWLSIYGMWSSNEAAPSQE